MGLLLSAIFSAMMSSLSSVFNSAATIFSLDVYAHFYSPVTHTQLRTHSPTHCITDSSQTHSHSHSQPGHSAIIQSHLIRVGRIAAVVLAVFSLLWLLLIPLFGKTVRTVALSPSPFPSPFPSTSQSPFPSPSPPF